MFGEARREWNRVVPVLDGSGLLATIDRGVLVRYCKQWATWIELTEDIDKTGKLVQGYGGNLVRNPLWMLRAECERTLTELGRQLFLAPMARLRSGIKHEGTEEERPPGVTAIEDYKKALG